MTTKYPAAAKLSLEQAIAIRDARRRGVRAPHLATEYGVSLQFVHNVLAGRSYAAHVTADLDDREYLALRALADAKGVSVEVLAAQIIRGALNP